MYDQSLEQLIDAVIEDGVITDQERKVVYKKAASLGIDQDEIEVYLEGRLQKVQKSAALKSGKHGVVKTCPNCGAPVVAGSAKCPDCGFAYMGVEANSCIKELDDRLRAATTGNVFKDTLSHKKENIIRSFPVPNSREDLVEMLTYLEPKTADGAPSEMDAYIQKYNECLNKMRLSFPNDPVLKEYEKKLKKNQAKSKRNEILTIIGLILFAVGIPVITLYILGKEEEAKMEYVNGLIEEINQLPTPSTDNYLDCYRRYSKIAYTQAIENKDDSLRYMTFEQVKFSYGSLLKNAYITAGVTSDNIPEDLVNPKSLIQPQAYNKLEEGETPEEYSQDLIQQIQDLPVPDSSNYEDCYLEFSNIKWTKEFKNSKKARKDFAEAKVNYAEQLKKAYSDADVDKDYIPDEIKKIKKSNYTD